jgi:hypothetical protein
MYANNPASNSDAEQTIQTERYRQQLELRQMQSANPNSLGFGAGASYDPAPAAGSILQQPVVGTVAGMGPRQNAANQPSQPASAQEVFDVQGPTVQGGLPVQPAAQGLASLDFELPPQDDLRWTIYYFTTPRGNVEITARSLSDDLLRRVGFAGGTLAVLLCIALAVRRGIGGGGRWIARPAATTTLILLGILALILGVLPVLGFLAIIAGLAMKFSRMGQKSATAS